MIDGDTVRPSSLRGVTAGFNPFDFNNYRRADHGIADACSCYSNDRSSYRGGIPILESDVLILDRGVGCTDGSGVAGLVVLVARGGVFSGDGKASRVARDLEAVTAVCGDSDFLRRIDGRPYPRRGNDAALCGVGGTGRGNDLAPHGGGVGGGLGSAAAAGRGTGGEQCRYGQARYQL